MSRITNAISLQAAAIRDSVNIRNVITELLEANTVLFSDLFNYDEKNLLKILTHISEESKKLVNAVSREDVVKVSNGTEWLNTLKGLVSTFEDIHQINKIDIVVFLNGLYGDSFAKKATSCNDTVIETFLMFYKVIRSAAHNTNGTLVKESINTFLDLETELFECLDNISSYKSIFIPIVTRLNFFTALEKTIKSLNSKIPNKKDVFEVFDVLSKAFGYIEGIWKSSSRKTDRKTSALFQEAVTKLQNIFEKRSEAPPLLLTNGFPRKGDMARVSADIDSKWFKDHVSKGSSTANLKHGLGGFFRFAELMKILEESWIAFERSYHQSKHVGIELSKLVHTIEEYTDNGQAILQMYQKSFEKCYTGSAQPANSIPNSSDKFFLTCIAKVVTFMTFGFNIRLSLKLIRNQLEMLFKKSVIRKTVI